MNWLGEVLPGSTTIGLTSTDIRARKVTLAKPERLVKMVADLDGLGSDDTVEGQAVQPLIYEGDWATRKLVAQGDVFEVPKGMVRQWVDLRFLGREGMLLSPGEYVIALHFPRISLARTFGQASLMNRARDPRFVVEGSPYWSNTASSGYLNTLSRRDPLPPEAGSGYGWHVRATTPTDTAVRTIGVISPNNTTDSVPVGASQLLTLVADVFVTQLGPTTRARIDTIALDAAGVNIGSKTGVSHVIALGWNRIFETWTTPALTTALRFNADLRTDSPDITVEAYFTRFMVIQGEDLTNPLVTYFDGDTPDFLWAGEPHLTSSLNGARWVDSFADGPLATRPASLTEGARPRIALVTTEVPTLMGDDLQLSRYAFETATVLLAGDLDPEEPRFASCEWYGHRYNDEQGANALVRRKGPLVGLVGERLRVSNPATGRSVVVYCHDDDPDIATDIALSRRAFQELELLDVESLDVVVEELV